MLLEGGYGGENQRTAANSHFPSKYTAFDQSLIPLSAVVKGCVLEVFGPNIEAAVVGEFSTAWRRTKRRSR